MASIRHGPRYGSARPDERIQAPPTRPTLGAGAGMYRPAASADNSTHPQPRRAMEPSLRSQPQEGPSTSRVPTSSRIPQVQTASRRPPIPRQTSSRPPLTHQDKPWSSGSGSGLGLSSRSASSGAVPTPSQPPTRQAEELKPRPVRNVLRRKSANLGLETAKLRTQPATGASPRNTDSPASITRSLASPDSQLDRTLTDSPAEIRIAMQVDLPTTSAQTVRIYPELDRYRDARPAGSGYAGEVPYPLSTHDLPPPTPLFSGTSSQPSAYSGSPSTRFSGSPGPGPYSRDTTPTTSIPSHSPGLVAPLRIPAPRVRQNSPVRHQQSSRPPVTRRRAGSVPNEVDSISADPHGLAAVREALNSSSSGSTVREGDRKKAAAVPSLAATAASSEAGSDKKKKKKPETASPPSPPPRKSSTRFKDARDAQETSPSKPAREPARPVMASRPTPPALARAHTATPSVTSPRGVPPSRPSRDGTSDIQSQIGLPIPVVQSNLSSSSIADRRQSLPLGSGSRIAAGNVTTTTARSATPSSQPPQSRLPTIGRQPTPVLPRLETRRPSHSGSTTSRSPSPNVSTFRTRFPLFGRRTKTAPEAVPQVADQKDKAVRRGPAAGTGHEGYGRVGMSHHRRRSSSIARGVGGTMSSQTMSSQESLERSMSDDPFLLERMNPVVIAGGEVVQNHNVGNDLGRTESNQSLPGGFSRTGSDVSLALPSGDRTTLWPSPFPRNATNASPSIGSRRPSDSSDSEAMVMRSTLAFRRSMHKMKDSADAAMRMPKPIITRTQGVTSPALTSFDTAVMTDDSAIEAPVGGAFKAIKGPAPAAGAPKKLTKRAKSPRRWNFFGRSTSQPAVSTKAAPEPVKPVAAVSQPKASAFYTIDFSEMEDNDAACADDDTWDAKLHAAVPLPPDPQPLQTQPPTTRRPSVTRATTDEEEQLKRGGVVEPLEYREQRSPVPQSPQWTETPLVATPEPMRLPAVPAVPAEPEPQPAARRVGRPSRLPQVGRIPKVVNSRPEQTSPKSFSRPFNRISVQLAPRGEIKDADSVAKGPSPEKPSTPVPIPPTPPAQSAEASSATVFGSSFNGSRDLTPDLANMMTEFLAFSPRKNSQSTTCTTTTTSSCSSGIVSYADATAVVPAPNAPLVEDEIWVEYDDFFGDETVKVPPSASSSHENPFHLEQYTERMAKKAVEQPLESPTLTQTVRLPAIDATATGSKRPLDLPPAEPEKEKVPVPSSIYSTDMTEPLNEAIETGLIPISSPFSVSEFVSGYGDGSQTTTQPLSLKSPAPAAAAPSKPPTSLRRNSTPLSNSSPRRLPHQKRASDASGASSLLSDLDASSPLSQVNLRVGSMTVSKWLTFGHVLFSPVRDELVPEVGASEEPFKRHSILVIDGLGNDDWSFYAAETYPAATFFNLSPRAPLAPGSSSSAGSFPLTPPNHHQIRYKSHLDKFPFGPESFTAVVYRFPAAAPESHFRNIVAEARRVLKPGGYMELSILDVDLNNMGNRSRRVVRRLKERIHAVKPDTCLGSTADLLLRLLGRKGFVDIKSCRVGVPVASRLATSSTSSAGDSAVSTTDGPSSPLARGAAAAGAPRRKKDDRSLAEIMRDESPVADESITKMVAKVGRWWFTRCYEPSVGSPGFAGSVWNDKLLLSECQEWGTSLKLMVCHARVPDGRARVASI